MGEDIHFPTEDDICDLLNNSDIVVSSTEQEDSESVRKFGSEEPVAVIWDEDDMSLVSWILRSKFVR